MSGVILEARDFRRIYEVRRGMFGGVATVKALADVSFTWRGKDARRRRRIGLRQSTLGRSSP